MCRKCWSIVVVITRNARSIAKRYTKNRVNDVGFRDSEPRNQRTHVNKLLSLFLICLLLSFAGCSNTPNQVEQTLRGEWKEERESFFATFSDSHTGFVSFKGRQQPFAWTILKDGRVQVTDPVGQVFYLQFYGNNLKIVGTTSVLFKLN
jgi:hypothetical protein